MSTTPAISSEVATGRWMKGSEIFTAIDLSGGRCDSLGRGGCFHMGTDLQLILAIDNDPLVGLESVIDQGFSFFDLSYFYRDNLDGVVVFDSENVGTVGTTLDGRCGNDK